ncbi:MAG TPA: thioredoxin domain-containing protein, partial [Polyangiaceae bacterium]|nr:thioredoxin domain-containing protein [Polyangiaceae bacterium]
DVVLVGPRERPATRALARAASRAYVPDRVLAWADPANPASLDACRALAEGKPAHADPVAYVCRGRTCSAPIREPAELVRALQA